MRRLHGALVLLVGVAIPGEARGVEVPSPGVVACSPEAPPPVVCREVERRPALEGWVVGAAGEGLGGVTVWRVVDGDAPWIVAEAVSAADGSFRLGGDAAGTAGPLWLSGPGCLLVVFPAPPPGTPAELQCAVPFGVLVVRLQGDGPDAPPLAGRRLLVRQDTVAGPRVIPQELLRRHLASFGLSAVTDGTGTMVLALAPGSYGLYLYKPESLETIRRELAHGLLGEVVVVGGGRGRWRYRWRCWVGGRFCGAAHMGSVNVWPSS